MEGEGFAYKENVQDRLAFQRASINLAKKQQTEDEVVVDDAANSGALQPATEEQTPQWVPLALAMQGPGAVAWALITEASCTEEQIDAIALLANSLQKRFDARPDKSSHLLPVAAPQGNHRAVWLGGGGVGKTRTLQKVVEPLAVTYFGEDGYSATAQANQAAQNLGPRGRTIHSANGLLATSSMQTAKLRLNAQSRKKMDRHCSSLGVDVIDELGCVSGSLLHADALRKTYGRCLRHNISATDYMKPQESWGRMPAKILCGDFYQLPPVPASSSLLAPVKGQTYEHMQGRKLLADIEHVVDFVQMQRFTDPLQVEVLEAMRTPGGKEISEAGWNAIHGTEVQSYGSATQPAAVDPRLRAARGWYESAYEWRIVSYAMQCQARMNAYDADRILFYVPAADRPAVRLDRNEFDEMRAEPNLSKTQKLAGILPVYIGMEMILTESILPPRKVRGSACKVVGLELHPREAPIAGRESIATHGCVLLRYMPKCIYVRLDGHDDVHLQQPVGASQPDAFDMKGVLAMKPVARAWKFANPRLKNPVQVDRTQIPLLPKKQCTLHGVQGKTAEPGFIVHWAFPRNLSKESLWLAYYVSLSRPRSFSKLLSHGLPSREVIEAGPPEAITDAFKELFSEKIAATKLACIKARAELGWPKRKEV
jgi:hypothetical protein